MPERRRRTEASRARPSAVLAMAVAVSLLAATACGSDQSPAALPPSAPVVALDPTLQVDAVAARDRGAEYLADHYGDIDPLHLSGLGYLHRRWGIDALDGAADAGRQALERIRTGGNGQPSADRGPGVDATEILALQRYVNPDVTDVPDASTLSEVAALVAGGLYCDVAPLDDEALARWDDLTQRGGYEATHVVMAWFTATDVGCTDPAMAAAGRRAADRVAADLADRVAAGLRPGEVDDLLIEQAAFLERVGRGDVLTPALVTALVAAQLPDGGWPLDAGGTTPNWHATALAVWALSAATTPSADARWVEV